MFCPFSAPKWRLRVRAHRAAAEPDPPGAVRPAGGGRGEAPLLLVLDNREPVPEAEPPAAHLPDVASRRHATRRGSDMIAGVPVAHWVAVRRTGRAARSWR